MSSLKLMDWFSNEFENDVVRVRQLGLIVDLRGTR
jgi:hypothetical protein